MPLFQKYICIKQHDQTDCAAACLATISKHYGLKISIAKIRELAGTDKDGTNVLGVVKAAEKIGFTVKGVKYPDTLSLLDSINLKGKHNASLLSY